MKTAAQERRSYAPNGVEGRRPVAMRLMPHEKSELEAMAAREDRSAGSLARLIYLKGLAVMKEERALSRAQQTAVDSGRCGALSHDVALQGVDGPNVGSATHENIIY